MLRNLYSFYKYFFFFFNDTATTEIYTLSLHDALPILILSQQRRHERIHHRRQIQRHQLRKHQDRKSTRLNSSHSQISYAVFCLKKKKKKNVILLRNKKKISLIYNL